MNDIVAIEPYDYFSPGSSTDSMSICSMRFIGGRSLSGMKQVLQIDLIWGIEIWETSGLSLSVTTLVIIWNGSRLAHICFSENNSNKTPPKAYTSTFVVKSLATKLSGDRNAGVPCNCCSVRVDCVATTILLVPKSVSSALFVAFSTYIGLEWMVVVTIVLSLHAL